MSKSDKTARAKFIKRSQLERQPMALKKYVQTGQEDLFQHIVKDGGSNDFPDFLIDVIGQSPAAASCMLRLKAFVAGKGFENDTLAKVMANEDETLEEVHMQIAHDLAFFGRFAVRVVPTASGKISALFHVPAEAVRYHMPDREGNIRYATVNYFYNTTDELLHRSKHYPLLKLKGKLNGAKYREDIAQFEADFPSETYHGHIYFFNRTSEQNRIYSRPYFTSAITRMQVDERVGMFHEANTRNNFFAGAYISPVGDPNEALKDEKGEVYSTRGEEFSKELSAAFSGAEQAGGIFVDWRLSNDDETKVMAWPGSTNHEMFDQTERSAREAIAIAMGIPLVLLGVPTAGKLGDSQEIRNAIGFVNQMTEASRMTLEAFYDWLAPAMLARTPRGAVKIKKLQSFADLGSEIMAMLSPAQLQQYLQDQYGIKPDNSQPEPQPDTIVEETIIQEPPTNPDQNA